MLVTQTGSVSPYDFNNLPYFQPISTNDKQNTFFDVFNVYYAIYLDHKLIAIKSYYADLVYFLKNTKTYTPQDIYSFFSKDLTAFNQEIYLFFNFLGVYNEIQWDENFNLFHIFNRRLKAYIYEPQHNYYSDIYLLYDYFVAFILPKFVFELKPYFTQLAKDNLNMHMDYQIIQKNNNWQVKLTLVDDKTNISIYDSVLDYTFTPFLRTCYQYLTDYTNTFIEEIAVLENKIQTLITKFKDYLQTNFYLALNMIDDKMKASNKTDFHNLANSNNIYISSNLQYQYPNFRPDFDKTKINSLLVIWKYTDNKLVFAIFNKGN